jgi:hypothetical protein
MTILWPAPEHIFSNEKPGIRYYLIMAALSQLPPELDKQAYHQEALKILNQFNEKVATAIKHDKDGNTALVLPILEQLVEEGYDQIYPYTYLKEHYANIGEQEEVQRITKAFRKLVERFQEKGINRPDLIADIEE